MQDGCMDHWTLTGSDDQTIFGNTHHPEGTPVGVMLICHGFKGYKDYGFLPHVAAAAARAGFIAHRFNFSHSGMTERIETFERPDLFEKDTWGRQVFDLQCVARAVSQGHLAGQGLPMVIFGHSRGGTTALLAMREVFDGQVTDAAEPAALITAASPDYCCNLDSDQQRQLREAGRLEIPSSRTGQMLAIGKDWLAEQEAEPERFDPRRAASRIRCPVLILHGREDPTVPVTSAHELAQAVGDTAQLQLIDGASHTFNAANPLPLDQTPPKATQQMIEAACAFALEHCQQTTA
jgi:alpha-beta hydrolase superfamily lysophospholipase